VHYALTSTQRQIEANVKNNFVFYGFLPLCPLTRFQPIALQAQNEEHKRERLPIHIERKVYHPTWHKLRQGLYTGKELQHARPSLIYCTHSKLNHTDEDLVAANGKPQPFKGRSDIYDLIAQAPPPDTRRVNPIAKRSDL
jgi:hypothetical protein